MIHLPFIPVTIGALLETFGIHGALMVGITASMVTIAVGMIIMTWQTAGFLSALGAVVFASVFSLGVDAAMKHDASSAANASAEKTQQELQEERTA